MRDNRYIGALTLIPVLLLIFIGGWPMKVTIMLLAFRGLHEIYHVLERKGHRPDRFLGYVGISMIYAALLFARDPLTHLGMVVPVTLFLVFIRMIFSKERTIVDAALTLAGLVYAGMLFGFLILASMLPQGMVLIYLAFIIAWLTDTMAYYAGRLFGRHKLIERVSPKKTVEGSVGGLVGGAVGALLLGLYFQETTGISPMHFLIMGLLGSIFGQIGDLAASSIKRYTGEKDFPKLFPGHGGVMDRFDSILFVALIVYLYSFYVVQGF